MLEIENKRKEKISLYLQSCGLDNCVLSADEKQALIDYQTLNWGKFNLEKLFGKSTRGKRLKSADRIEYSYAAEPPVQVRLRHLSRRSEPL